MNQTYLEIDLEGPVFDEVDVWLPDVSVMVQSVQSRVPVFVFLLVVVFIVVHSVQIWVPGR